MANVDIIEWVALFYKLGAALKDFVRNEKFRVKLPRSILAQIANVYTDPFNWPAVLQTNFYDSFTNQPPK